MPATVTVRDDAYSFVDILRAEIHPTNDALDHLRVLVSQIQKELCFFFRLASLHSDGPVHSIATDATFQLRRKEVSTQRFHVLVQPGKGLGVLRCRLSYHRLVNPKVLMRVDMRG